MIKLMNKRSIDRINSRVNFKMIWTFQQCWGKSKNKRIIWKVEERALRDNSRWFNCHGDCSLLSSSNRIDVMLYFVRSFVHCRLSTEKGRSIRWFSRERIQTKRCHGIALLFHRLLFLFNQMKIKQTNQMKVKTTVETRRIDASLQ